MRVAGVTEDDGHVHELGCLCWYIGLYLCAWTTNQTKYARDMRLS